MVRRISCAAVVTRALLLVLLAAPATPAGLPSSRLAPPSFFSFCTSVRNSYSVSAAGSVWAWGDNRSAQLGQGVPTYRATPVKVADLADVVAIAAELDSAYALKSDGTVWAWGYCPGVLSSGGDRYRSIPVEVPGLSGVVAIAADLALYALGSDGRVRVWDAAAAEGWLDASGPKPVPGLSEVTAISAGGGRLLALKADGTVWAMSRWTEPQTPTMVSGLPRIGAIAGGSPALALAADGTLWGWGLNLGGLLDATYDGTAVGASQPEPVRLADVSGAVAAATTFKNGYVRAVDGCLWAWGKNWGGQLGDGSRAWESKTPTRVLVDDVIDVAAATDAGLAVSKDGSVWAWGSNFEGLLGRLDLGYSRVPLEVQGLPRARAIAAGSRTGYVLTDAGEVWAWGCDADGQLGIGSLVWSSRPLEVVSLSRVVAVASGYEVGLALKEDGTVWGWGQNFSLLGPLKGPPEPSTREVPVQIPGLDAVRAIASSNFTAYAIRSDGSLWAWGLDQFGGVGDGGDPRVMTRADLPVRVADLSDVVAVAGGKTHVCALTADGRVWSWGSYNRMKPDGQRDDCVLAPVEVAELPEVRAIAAGSDASYALRADGSVWAWGHNEGGQLGEASTRYTSKPVRVKHLPLAKAIAAGEGVGCALSLDGRVWVWGGGSGLLHPAASVRPRSIPDLSDVVAMSVCPTHALFLRADGTLWALGNNDYGQLGDGTSRWTRSPVRVLLDAP